jgi:hypothetical protein
MGDRTRGLPDKFIVTRTDGTSAEGGKHHECQYFVLDVDHDPHAKAALLAYAESCKAEYPLLHHDVRALAILAPKRYSERPEDQFIQGDAHPCDLARAGLDPVTGLPATQKGQS